MSIDVFLVGFWLLWLATGIACYGKDHAKSDLPLVRWYIAVVLVGLLGFVWVGAFTVWH